MRRHLISILVSTLLGSLATLTTVRAQDTGHMAGMGMAHDSAGGQMAVIHQLVMNHEKIRRTVTNLDDGVRAVTESDDPAMVALIRQHVGGMQLSLAHGHDPQLPMESATTHAIFDGAGKVRTRVDSTALGVVVVQTSTDPAIVKLLQEHAAEVSDLVKRGMAAMHDGMMGGMMGGMMHADSDTAFASMQMRGRAAMGVDQYTSTHRFDALPDGGRIELQRDVDDAAGVAQIREHLQGIAQAFRSGDFSTPAFVHMQQVPGAAVMAAKRALITYTYHDLPRGGELRMATRDSAALEAIHAFMAFQRGEHHASGKDSGK